MCNCDILRALGIRNFSLVCRAHQQEQYGLIIDWLRNKGNAATWANEHGWRLDTAFTQRVMAR